MEIRGMVLKVLAVLTCSFLFAFSSLAQEGITPEMYQSFRGDLRFVFYNVENLFDCEDEPGTDDNAFLPAGEMNWTPYRYQKKLQSVYKVIASAGGWNPPEIIGLCEIENRRVLDDLLHLTPLSKHTYRAIHRDSRDSRGTDLALLYNPDLLSPVDSGFYYPFDPLDRETASRDILYVKFIWNDGGPLYVFLNHWPSRFTGMLETADKRKQAAAFLIHLIDSVASVEGSGNYIVAGDFNDSPQEESILNLTSFRFGTRGREQFRLVNAARTSLHPTVTGTHKYQGIWYPFDMVFVPDRMNDLPDGDRLNPPAGYIYAPDFLLQPDDNNLGVKPFRTFSGPLYLGGYSDHLPVFIDLYLPVNER